MSLPLRLTLRFVLNIILVWALVGLLPGRFVLGGGLAGSIVIGALLTLMNLLVRPLLDIITLPLKIIGSLLGAIIVNGAFVWFVVRIASWMDPAVVTLRIEGGIPVWTAVILVFGIGNWLMKMLLR